MSHTGAHREPSQALRLNRCYLGQGFRVRPARSRTSHHWQGGPAPHLGATCLTCERELVLLWDIGCTDPQLLRSGLDLGGLARLPLYYCFGCRSTLSYRMMAADHIDVMETPDPDPREGLPYEGFPTGFDRRPIELDPIPLQIHNLLLWMQEVEVEDWLVDADKQTLSLWFGREIEDKPDLWRHQFGGAPYLLAGHEELLCPNLSCELSRPWVRNEIQYTMKELAVIHNDPAMGLPLIDPIDIQERNEDPYHWAQLVFHICDQCLTLRVSYRTDY